MQLYYIGRKKHIPCPCRTASNLLERSRVCDRTRADPSGTTLDEIRLDWLKARICNSSIVLPSAWQCSLKHQLICICLNIERQFRVRVTSVIVMSNTIFVQLFEGAPCLSSDFGVVFWVSIVWIVSLVLLQEVIISYKLPVNPFNSRPVN